MQIPAGFLADRAGLKIIFFIGVLGTTVLCFAFGLISEYWQAFLNQTLTGFFRAFIFASGVALLASWFSPERRATAMGLSVIGLFWGPFLFNFIGPFMVDHFNWRFPFFLFASVGILSSLAYLRFGREASKKKKGYNISIRQAIRLFRHRFMWVCGILQFVRLGVMSGMAFWLPSFLMDEKGLTLHATGLVIALRSLLMAPSNIIGGYISDRLNNPNIVIGTSVIVLAVTTTLLIQVTQMIPLTCVIVLNSLFVQMYFGPLFALPVERYGTHMTGTLTGFGNFFANLGGFTFSYLLGLLKDRTGQFDWGFYIISGACVVSLLFNGVLGKMRQGHPEG
jgi:nitrate/nitrite transporter NarK